MPIKYLNITHICKHHTLFTEESRNIDEPLVDFTDSDDELKKSLSKAEGSGAMS